jgi:hypothetical protein
MQASIETSAASPASEIFDDVNFKNVLEDHLSWFINHPNTSVIPVTAHQIEVYDFDWIGLLQNLKIPSDLHWLVIRMNDGMSLTDVPSLLRALKVPDYNVVQNLVILHTSTKRIR